MTRFTRSVGAWSLTALFAFPMVFPFSASAASSDDCGIWLCLPTGFKSGCSGPKKAFLKRIKRFKPPLPSFTSCLLKGAAPGAQSDKFTADYGYAAYIPPKRYCIKTRLGFQGESACLEWGVHPEQYIKKRRCRKPWRDSSHYLPKGCRGTVRYTEVYRNGVLFGQPHYY